MASLYNSIIPHTGSLPKFVEYIKMGPRIAQKEIRYTESGADLVAAQVGIDPMTWTFTASQTVASLLAIFPGAVLIGAISHH